MSTLFLFTDNATSLLASGITNVQTTLNVTPTQGAYFPSPGAGQQFAVTVEDTSGNQEVMYCTGRTSDTLTVVRGAETIPSQIGGPALAFASGSRVEMRVTSGTLAAFLQKNGGDTLTGSTNLNGVIALGSSGSIQGGEYAGDGTHPAYLRSGTGITAGQISVQAGAGYVGSSIILTGGASGNVGSNLPSGLDLCRTGMIVFWAGSLGSIPTGWQICDGTANAPGPNLTDQFIVGRTENSVLAASGTYSANTTVQYVTQPVVGSHVLAAAELPTHQHPFDYFFGNATAVVGIPGFANGGQYISGLVGGGTRISFAGSNQSGSTGSGHTHGLTDSVGHQHQQQIPYTGVFPIQKM